MAQQIPNGKQQFFNGNGTPLAGGSVYFYQPGTLTPVTTYQDPALSIANANPVVLDANGMAPIWGTEGQQFRQILKDSNGNTIWDVTTGFPTGAPQIQSDAYVYGVDGGSANAYTVTLDPAITAMTAGMMIRFLAAHANTAGVSTLNVNGLGAVDITQNGSTSLTAGVIPQGAIVTVLYDGTYFQLDGPYWASPTTGLLNSTNTWTGQNTFQQAVIVPAATAGTNAPNLNQVDQREQSQTAMAFTTAGSYVSGGTPFTLTPSPALTAYAAGQRFNVTFNVAGGAAPTINISSLGSLNLMQYDSAGSLGPAVVVANMNSDVIVLSGTQALLLEPLAQAVIPTYLNTGTGLPTAAGTYAAPHTLGRLPYSFQLILTCTTAEHGYAVGDRVLATTAWNGSGSTVPIIPWATSTQVGFTFQAAQNQFAIMDRSTNSQVTPTSANWNWGFLVQ